MRLPTLPRLQTTITFGSNTNEFCRTKVALDILKNWQGFKYPDVTNLEKLVALMRLKLWILFFQ